MSIAALILSILGFLISLSIFKDLSLILCVLAIVLGIIALVKKKGKAICIISIVLAVFGLIFVFSENSEITVSSNNSNTSNNNTSVSQPDNKEETKTYGLNEEITIKTSDEEYTLTITGIQEMKERNEFSEKSPAQVFLIDYTYKNISSDDTIYISGMDFKIIDEQGEIGDTYPNDTSRSPKPITEGITCKSQMVLCVNNESSKVKLQYFDNSFNSKPDATFELDIVK